MTEKRVFLIFCIKHLILSQKCGERGTNKLIVLLSVVEAKPNYAVFVGYQVHLLK